jgi:hypothetical protein
VTANVRHRGHGLDNIFRIRSARVVLLNTVAGIGNAAVHIKDFLLCVYPDRRSSGPGIRLRQVLNALLDATLACASKRRDARCRLAEADRMLAVNRNLVDITRNLVG